MTPQSPVHTCQQFSFFADAPFDVTWPLFGAQGERVWAPGWDPAFIWPTDLIDRQGMVFTISHGLGTAIWINTVFDALLKRIQYVYVIPEVVATVISLEVRPLGEATQVAVTYERTSLSEATGDQVRELGEGDKMAGEEWSRQINDYLRARRAS